MEKPARFASIDIVRGIVMVLMAIDHVRVYSGVPAGGPSAGVFFTRWVTHFCAPVFVFLAGTSAFMLARSLPNRAALARYFVSRGLLLVLLELTVIRASWTFGVDYSQFILAGVIWMLGWCMVLMAAIVWLPVWAIGTMGVAIMAGQDVFRSLPAGWLSQIIYLGGDVTPWEGGPSVSILYVIVPWIGVMAAGFAFGAILTREPAMRRRLCLRIGFGATAVFLLAAGAIVLMHAPADGGPPAYMRLLNQRKYPASQLFLLMTLGPAIALMPFVERARGPVSRMFETFGRVPMFYYLLHIPLIHALSLIAWRLRDGTAHAEWFATAPYVFVPPPQRWSLGLLYLVFAITVALLYPVCRWYSGRKIKYL
jgi:uncharacterized membrane protein